MAMNAPSRSYLSNHFIQIMYRTKFIVLLLLLTILQSSCRKHKFDSVTQGAFTISAVPSDKPRIFRSTFTKHVSVFGVDIYATRAVDNDKVFHTANVMAQYLDNDEDGVPDNPAVITNMTRRNAFLFMFKNQRSPAQLKFMLRLPSGYTGQSLYDKECKPGGSGHDGFDATLEEVLHLITHVGYANTYPSVFGEHSGSEVAKAMDIARGGNFTDIPDNYPSGAWYTYDDKTCEYDCMVAEYLYWALTSILGAQSYSGRLDEISNEWDLNTRELVETRDPAIYQILTDPQYFIPTTLPDGKYR